MPSCEICGQNQLRRYRLDNGKLVCFTCETHYHWPKEDLLAWIKRLKDDIDHWRKQAYIHKPRDLKYKYNSPFSAIPPIDILRNAVLALNTEGKYSGFPLVLADYYTIEAPPFWDNPDKVPKGAVACYIPWDNEIYSRGKMSRESAFHEIYHALENFGIVPKTTESEKNADQYAKGCMDRLGVA